MILLGVQSGELGIMQDYIGKLEVFKDNFPLTSNTDHLPLATTLDLSYYQPTTTSRFNFHTINWTEFEEALENCINGLAILGNLTIQSTDELEAAVGKLFQTIQDPTCERVLLIKPSPHLKCWWTKELTVKCKGKRHTQPPST